MRRHRKVRVFRHRLKPLVARRKPSPKQRRREGVVMNEDVTRHVWPRNLNVHL